MPNYTHHRLTITGAGDELDRFMAECFTQDKELYLDFTKLIPSPEGADRDWAREHWGTASCACFTRVTRLEGGSIKLSFDTAWSPPTRIFEEIAKRFPSLTIEGVFFDECYNFGGDVRIDAGEFRYIDKSTEYHAAYEKACAELGNDVAGCEVDLLDVEVPF